MQATKLLKPLNIILFLDFLLTIFSVAIYKYAPLESLNGAEWLYELHEIAGKLMFVLVCFHIYLNFNWIKSQIFGIKPKSKKK